MKQLRELDLKMARGLFELLATDCYSMLWRMVDDFTCNGHLVSLNSNQFYHVVIDGVLYKIGGLGCMYCAGVRYEHIDWAMKKLSEEV